MKTTTYHEILGYVAATLIGIAVSKEYGFLVGFVIWFVCVLLIDIKARIRSLLFLLK